MKNITHALPEDAAAILELQKLACQIEAQIYSDWNIPPLAMGYLERPVTMLELLFSRGF
jgi:hypothetical protein